MIPMKTLIIPACDYLAGYYGLVTGPAAYVMTAAPGQQESNYEARDQLEVQNGKLVAGAVGPATGFWQFEKMGGVHGVMTHAASRNIARDLAKAVGVDWTEDAIWRFFTTMEGDELAVSFARLLLLTDPQPLPEPTLANEEKAFGYYLRNWRPGAWFNSAPDSAKRNELRAKWGRSWSASIAAAADAPSAPVAEDPTAALRREIDALKAKLANIAAIAAS